MNFYREDEQLLSNNRLTLIKYAFKKYCKGTFYVYLTLFSEMRSGEGEDVENQVNETDAEPVPPQVENTSISLSQ